ncbi:hypothetical protein ACGC1H_003489 [Rhizoctonia solani]
MPHPKVLPTPLRVLQTMRREIESIGNRQSRDGLRRVLGPTGDDEDLMRRYRRIEQLFRQLQGEASLSAWSITSKHFVNMQLESLRPAKLARYNSEISTEVIRRACTENTRVEILGNITKWSEVRSTPSIYWMNGMAGTGKTTIAYSTCVALEASKQLAASFFCTRMSPECRDAKRIVPTIAYQLARRSAPFRCALCRTLEEQVDIGTGTIFTQFEHLLRNPLMEAKENMPNNLVVVVDALDECSDPYIVELFLGLLFRSAVDLPIKFFVTSRPEPVIRRKMISENERSRSILYLHEIEQSLVQADIKLYLRDELVLMSPKDIDIEQLAQRAGNLFIYAATAVRYIRPPGKSVNSQERLETVLGTTVQPNRGLIPIDMLYSVILKTAITEDKELEPAERERMLFVLWTAVCACEPALISTIAAISGIGNKDKVVAALEPLRSVLHISDYNETVTTLHASFPDYILNRERSGQFACDVSGHNYILSLRCFEIMKAQLRFNICNIRSSFIPDREVPDLKDSIDANISEELFYACRFWVDHLGSGLATAEAYPPLQTIDEFLSQFLLFWMEVLNLKGCMRIGIASLSQLSAWLSRANLNVDKSFRDFISDIRAFMVSYASRPISNYTPHIYLSALPFSPRLSRFLSKFQGLITVSGTALERMQEATFSTWESDAVVLTTAFTPTGNCMVLGKQNGELSVQNIHDGTHVFHSFKAHTEPVVSVGVSRDGTQIVTGSYDMKLSIWDARDGSLVSGPFHGHIKGVTSVAFSPDATYIVSGSHDCTVGIWVSQDAAVPMRQFAGHREAVNSVSFSPCGTHVISGSSDHSVRLWDLFSGATIFTFEHLPRPVEIVQFTTDGSSIISCSPYGYRYPGYKSHNNVYIWDASNGTLRRRYCYGFESMSVSPQGHTYAGSLDHSIMVWSTYNGTPIAGPFEGHTKQITSINFSDDGTRLISASDDHTVRVWNINRSVNEFSQTSSSPWRIDPQVISVTLDQMCIAISGSTGFRIYNMQLRTTSHFGARMIANSPLIFLQFSLDALRVFSAHDSGVMFTWCARTTRRLDGPRRFGTRGTVKSAICSTDGTRIAMFSGDTIEIWDVPADRSIASHKLGEFHYLDKLIFSQTGNVLLTNVATDAVGVMNVWATDNGIRIAGPITHPWRKVLDFSSDGTYVACCPNINRHIYGNPLLFNTRTHQVIFMPGGGPDACYDTADVVMKFSSDDMYVACAMTGKYHVWNIHAQTAITVSTGVGTIPRSISYTADGWFLITVINDADNFQVWRFHIDRPLGTFTMRSNGWIVDDQSHLLFWVPAQARPSFVTSNGLSIGTEGSMFVDYSNLLIGEDWSRCYIGD